MQARSRALPSGWRRAGERAYGLRAPWLIARAQPRGEPLGVLPLFFVRSDPLRGYATTGLFGAYGPVLAEDDEIRALLIREACRRAREAGLASFRFKGLGEEPATASFASLDHWVIATLPLWKTADEAWSSIRGNRHSATPACGSPHLSTSSSRVSLRASGTRLVSICTRFTLSGAGRRKQF